jgi:hypothetical protein
MMVWPGSLGAPDQGTNEDCEGDETRVSLGATEKAANLHCLRDEVGSAVGHFTKNTFRVPHARGRGRALSTRK